MLRGYRTIIFNAAIAAATAALAHFSPELVSEVAGPVFGPFAVMALAAANMGLRFITNSPVGKAA